MLGLELPQEEEELAKFFGNTSAVTGVAAGARASHYDIVIPSCDDTVPCRAVVLGGG